MRRILLAAASAMALSAGAAQAADLGVPRTPIAAAVVAPAFNWTGFYVGANIGLGIVNTNFFAQTGYLPSTGTGLVAGGQLGYNYQVNNVVLGLEADLGYFGVNRSGNNGVFFGNWKTTWDASIRGRLGVAVDRTLLYVTGGVAFADLRLRINNNIVVAVVPPVIDSQVRVGWTVGAGIEHAITPNWTVRGEYLYANYGTKLLGGLNVSDQTHKVRLGVNYLFSTGPSAVVARY